MVIEDSMEAGGECGEAAGIFEGVGGGSEVGEGATDGVQCLLRGWWR